MHRNQTSLERSHDSAINNLKTTISELQKELNEKSRNLSRRSQELDDLRSAHSSQVSALERRYQDETSLYRNRAEEADRFAKELEAVSHAGDLKAQHSIDEIKDKYTAALHHLESQLRIETDAVKNMADKLRSDHRAIFCYFVSLRVTNRSSLTCNSLNNY